MAARASSITQSEVTRRVKGVTAAGVAVAKVIIGADGSVTILAAGSCDEADSPNPCDRLLK